MPRNFEMPVVGEEENNDNDKDVELESPQESLKQLQKDANEENLIDLGEYHGM